MYDMSLTSTQTESDKKFKEMTQLHFEQSHGTVLDKLNNFPRFVSRQSLSLFLAKTEIFKRIVNVHGNIIECGVFMGGGLFTWSQLSAIYEPYNHNRKIIGFDSFEGFVNVSNQDDQKISTDLKSKGTYSFSHEQDLIATARIHDLNRPIGHIPNVELVKGDALVTIPEYIKNNKHLVVSLLYLDFDLYEPTKCALEHIVSRMPKGAVIAFDELNQKVWPGETLAVLETLGLNRLKIERFNFSPSVSFAVLD